MAYYRRRNPYAAARAEERREREAKERVETVKGRSRLNRLYTRYERGPLLTGEESAYAWKQKSLRNYRTGTYEGVPVYETIRGDGKNLYAQEAGYLGWNFYKLTRRRKVHRLKLRTVTRQHTRSLILRKLKR